MRASSSVFYRAFCAFSLWLAAFIVASAQTNFSPSFALEPSFPLITNIAQLHEVNTSDPAAVFAVRLEGDVWWVSPAQRSLVLNDSTGPEELHLELNCDWPQSGDRVRLTGLGRIVRNGAGYTIGAINPVVDNDGLHKTLEKSGSLYLFAGRYPLRVEWFNAVDKPGLDVTFSGPGLARQRLGIVRPEATADGTNFVKGADYACYEGEWEKLPEFESLTPVKTGTSGGLDGKLRSRAKNSGMVFTAFFEAPKNGLYTFYLRSCDGSKLFVAGPRFAVELLGKAPFPAPRAMKPGQVLERAGGCWAELEGSVEAATTNGGSVRLELRNGSKRIRAEIGAATAFSPEPLLKSWIRARGFVQPAFTPDGQQVAGSLLVPDITCLAVVKPTTAGARPDENELAGPDANPETAPLESAPLLTTAAAVRDLRPEQARRGYPLKLRGVVTCVQPERKAFVIQDGTMGLYLTNPPSPGLDLPEVGEFLEVDGLTAEPGIGVARALQHLGAGKLPEPAHPTWSQLMNSSLDSQWVELSGFVEDVTNRPSGWCRLNLHTGGGVLKMDLRRAGVTPGPVEKYINTVIRLRGCIFFDWNADTLRLKVGQLRMHDAEILLEQPGGTDLFSQPSQKVATLTQFDPSVSGSRRVKVSGQVVFVRGADYFMMDGTQGLRFLAKEPLGLDIGDLVEVVGFPELSGAAPVLRGALARKVGHAELPAPDVVPARELNGLTHDSTRVRVEGIFSELKQSPDTQVLELQAGAMRYMARLYDTNTSLRFLKPGSKLELTGVYCAQGGYSTLGTDIIPLDILLSSAADIRVVAAPPWWTLERLLVVVGALGCLLALMLLWVRELRIKVEQRSAELALQIEKRERLEQQRVMEQERTRIAEDLHDELGSDITEIGMLAARAKSISSSEQERAGYLSQMGDKARQTVDVLEEIVWAMNPKHDSLESLASYFRFFAERFLGLANIAWEFDETPDSKNYTLDSRRRHELFLVFKEALTNIVRHSGATKAVIKMAVDSNELSFTIADNGRGLSDSSHKNGMDGIENMRRRTEKLGGRFEVQGKPSEGTTLRLFVPLN